MKGEYNERALQNNKEKIMAIGMTLCLVVVQSISMQTTIAEAADKDFSDIFAGMDSVVSQLLEFGLDIQEIEILLNLPSKDTAFFSQANIDSPYDGSFKVTNVVYPEVPQLQGVTDYDGNPAPTVGGQQNRFTTIYNIADKNFNTFRYEGSKNSDEDWGNYFFYLYLSNYVDGPFRAPTAKDLPEVISLLDVQAYERYLQGTSMANAGRKMSQFAMRLKSGAETTETILNKTHSLDTTVWERLNDAYTAYSAYDWEAKDSRDIAKNAIPYIMDKFENDFEGAQSEEQFKAMTAEYVNV